MPAGAVDLGGSNKPASVGYPVGAIHFGPACSTLWEQQPSLRELYDQACAGLVRAECEAEELRAEAAMLQEQARILADERDEALEALQQPPQISAILAGKMAGNTQSEQFSKLERERDLLRVQVRAGEGLGMALVKTIDELRTEKAELTVKLINLQERSRPATLEEIRDSVREKYDPEYEFGGRHDE
jgi:hypothetical protein